jgi:rhodanese-related sulfurtransferase
VVVLLCHSSDSVALSFCYCAIWALALPLPFSTVRTRVHGMQVVQRAPGIEAERKKLGPRGAVVVMCRRGNDSQVAAAQLRSCGIERVFDLVGGLHAWADAVDPNMPKL